MKNSYTTIGVRLAIVILLVGLVFLLSVLSRLSLGTTFAMDGFNLQIDSHATYNEQIVPAQTWALKDLVPGVDKFFDFNDVMPGDRGKTVISFHTNEDAYACMDFTNLVDIDNGTNEPEFPEDPNNQADGELSRGMEFFGWRDDGDNTYEGGEEIIFGDSNPQAAFDVLTEYILSDASTGSFFPANVTKYIGIGWCAGDLVVDDNTGSVTCDGAALGNIAQSDGFSVDLGLRVVKKEDFPGFRCDGSVVPPDSGVKLNLEKKFSGPVPEGYLPEQFTFHVVGGLVDTIVTLTPYTQDSANGEIFLEEGTYTITEIGPVGFVPADWRPGWYGECESGSQFSTTITIDEDNIEDGTLYCQVDNQYRPENNPANKSSNSNRSSGGGGGSSGNTPNTLSAQNNATTSSATSSNTGSATTSTTSANIQSGNKMSVRELSIVNWLIEALRQILRR